MLDKERWLPINGYEGAYEVSNVGRIRSLSRVITKINGAKYYKKGRMRVPVINGCGYLAVNLCMDGKCLSTRVHKIVVETFLGYSDLHVDHIDGDKKNNNIDNLEYVTSRENTRRYREGKRDLPVGVSVSPNGYRARINNKNKEISLGVFDTSLEASEAYKAAWDKIEAEKTHRPPTKRKNK